MNIILARTCRLRPASPIGTNWRIDSTSPWFEKGSARSVQSMAERTVSLKSSAGLNRRCFFFLPTCRVFVQLRRFRPTHMVLTVSSFFFEASSRPTGQGRGRSQQCIRIIKWCTQEARKPEDPHQFPLFGLFGKPTAPRLHV